MIKKKGRGNCEIYSQTGSTETTWDMKMMWQMINEMRWVYLRCVCKQHMSLLAWHCGRGVQTPRGGPPSQQSRLYAAATPAVYMELSHLTRTPRACTRETPTPAQHAFRACERWGGWRFACARTRMKNPSTAVSPSNTARLTQQSDARVGLTLHELPWCHCYRETG